VEISHHGEYHEQIRSSSVNMLTRLREYGGCHAILLEATPAPGASVAGTEIVFRLRFNSRVDAARSTLKLALPDGKMHPLAIVQKSAADSLEARSGFTKSGQYTLQWQVLSADGHITRGEIPFRVQ